MAPEAAKPASSCAFSHLHSMSGALWFTIRLVHSIAVTRVLPPEHTKQAPSVRDLITFGALNGEFKRILAEMACFLWPALNQTGPSKAADSSSSVSSSNSPSQEISRSWFRASLWASAADTPHALRRGTLRLWGLD